MNARTDRIMSIIMMLVMLIIGIPLVVVGASGGPITLFFAVVITVAGVAAMVLTFTDTYRRDER